jgi:hypothetical protein
MNKGRKSPGGGEPSQRRFSWHGAFFDAIRLELQAWQDVLDFQAEHPLNREPLRIDVLIIKKINNLAINKNIAAIFRRENILEFKGPDDSLSVADFHKVLAYAHLYYANLTKPGTGIRDITVSFVTTRHPREVLRHIRDIYGYAVVEELPGVYYIKGDMIPIQIIESRKLDEDENLWLKDLDRGLDEAGVEKLLRRSREEGKVALMRAYLDVVLGANSEVTKGVLEMKRVGLEQLLEETGWTALLEARGESKKALEIMKKALARGMSVEDVSDLTGLDPGTVMGFKDLPAPNSPGLD